MNSEPSWLPWDDLQHTQGGIPWPALRSFADAVAIDIKVARELFDVYDRAHQAVLHETCYADLYVPAIFAMAAPKLNDEQRDTIGAFLLDRLAGAGRDDDDMGLEVLTAAVGTLGPVILPALLDTIAKEPDTWGAWIFLWSLTVLAAETDDPALRDPVIRECVGLLERVEQGEVDLHDAHNAAWTLGLLKCTEYTDLLRRLAERAEGSYISGDYAEALRLLEGGLDHTPAAELWERPVEKWLKSFWKTTRDWFARRDAEPDEEYAAGENEEDADSRHARLLTTKFIISPIAAGLPAELLEDARFIVDRLVYYSVGHVGVYPKEWDEPTLRELLLEIFPRKLSGDAELFAKVAPVTEAFLSWLGSQGLLADADVLARAVGTWSDEIIAAGMNPENWGPAKAFVMRAEEAGIDVTDPDVVRAFVDQQTGGVLNEAGFDRPEPTADEPPIPIVETAPKIGRNAPCPCGSGKKYKKCCGNPAAKNPTGK